MPPALADVTPLSMDVVSIKVLSGFLFFFIALAFGCIPFFTFRICFSSKPGYQNPGQSRLVLCLHALASGVLIATCLLHLLPESLENVQNALAINQRAAALHKARKKNISESYSTEASQDMSNVDTESTVSLYPVAELLVAAGFLVIFMIDSIMKSLQSNDNKTFVSNGIKYSRLKDLDDDDENELYVKEVKYSTSDGSRARKLSFSQDIEMETALEKSLESGDVIPFEDRNEGCIRSEQNLSMPDASKSSHNNEISQQLKRSDHVRSAALVMALCIHGFFDGVMQGLQTSASVLYSLLLALSFHKSFVATSLSLTLLKSYSPLTSARHIILYILLFAFVAPLGLVAGAAFIHSNLFESESKGDDDVSLVPGCIQAFAVGTFLYVTFMEVTGRHDEPASFRLEMLCHLFLLKGFVFMAIMRLTLSDS